MAESTELVNYLLRPKTGEPSAQHALGQPGVPQLPTAPEPPAGDTAPGWWERRRQRRLQARQLHAGTRQRRRNVPATVLAAAMLAVEIVVAYESFAGLVGFAHLIGIHGARAEGVPVTLDGVAVIAALQALRAELAGESSGLYRLTMLAFTAASAAANIWHGIRAGGPGTAIYYGAMSAAVTWLFMMSLRQIRADARREAQLVTDRLPHFSGWHWARFPARTFTAFSLAIRDGHKTSREALDAAKDHLEAKRQARESARQAKAAAALPPLELGTETLAAMSARDRLAVAFGAVGAVDIPRALALLADRGAPVDQSHAYQVRRQIEADGRTGGDQS
jgi:Protein of unknown function (DUF2637)